MSAFLLILAAWASAAQISDSTVDWLRTYPLTMYREHWSLTVAVKDMKKGLPAVLEAFEKSGAALAAPVANSAGGPAHQQLSYRLNKQQAADALKRLRKAGKFEPPTVRPEGERLPLSEIRKKVQALAADKKAHAAELAQMPAVSALVDAVLGHLATAQAVSEKAEDDVVLNVTVLAPPK